MEILINELKLFSSGQNSENFDIKSLETRFTNMEQLVGVYIKDVQIYRRWLALSNKP